MYIASYMKFMSQNKKTFFSVKDIALIGMMTAMLEAVKIALQAVPNVELVTLLIILFTLYLGWKTLLAVWAFVGIECVVWGIGLWTIMYVYVWPILVLLTLLIRKKNAYLRYCFLSGFFGLFFGAFCSIPYFFIGGPSMAISWWISGIPYDILHGISNFVLCLILFPALRKVQKGRSFCPKERPSS